MNKSFSLPQDYNPGGLTAETQAAWNKLQSAASYAGYNLWITSGFRSYWDQQTLYNNYVWRDGQAAADRYSARAGHSEHQSGLAIDVNYAGQAFVGTPEAAWLAANCADYGFIIRYPDGKENITGFKYEPWHIRYVGTDLAKKLTNSGLTIEEYFNIPSTY